MNNLCINIHNKIVLLLDNNNIIFVSKYFLEFRNILNKKKIFDKYKKNFEEYYEYEKIFQNIIRKLSLYFNIKYPILYNSNNEVINYDSINNFMITSNYKNSWIFRDVWNDLFSFNNIVWNKNEKNLIEKEFNIMFNF